MFIIYALPYGGTLNNMPIHLLLPLHLASPFFIPVFSSLIGLPNFNLPCYRPISFLINQWEWYIFTLNRIIIPLYSTWWFQYRLWITVMNSFCNFKKSCKIQEVLTWTHMSQIKRFQASTAIISVNNLTFHIYSLFLRGSSKSKIFLQVTWI